jgi:hypothetical protein
MDNNEKQLIEEATAIVEKKTRQSSEIYLGVLQQIEAENDGVIQPKHVVEAARDESSPLHNVFEWDDTIASEKFRMMQARVLMNQVKVELIGRKVPAYINATINVQNVPQKGYVNSQRLISDEQVHAQALASAARELEHWRRKYNHLLELKPLVNEEALGELIGSMKGHIIADEEE